MSHDDHDDKHFDANKIFYALLAFTVLEVGWGLAGKNFGWNRPMLWGGLLFFAFLKGWLIAVYFMHLKFEGWVVKSLILPTPFLILVIFGYVMPDVADEESNLIHPIGSEFDPASGAVIEHMDQNDAHKHPKEGEAAAAH
jgi:caa(3)-type oxidase subunit IV